MKNNNEITISIEKIEGVIKELFEIGESCSTPHTKAKIKVLQKFVSSFLELRDKASIEDIVYDKMVEVKHLNPELHLKLYMLYRNITENRISQSDARAAFESYVSMFPSDVMIF